MGDGIRRAVVELQTFIKSHPKEAAGIGAAAAAGALVLRRSSAGKQLATGNPAASGVATLYQDPNADSGYVGSSSAYPNLPPVNVITPPGATTPPATTPGSSSDGAHVPPTPAVSGSAAAKAGQLYGLHIPAPGWLMSGYRCPANYHFAPEYKTDGTGNWVCRPNRGATGKNDIQAIKK